MVTDVQVLDNVCIIVLKSSTVAKIDFLTIDLSFKTARRLENCPGILGLTFMQKFVAAVNA